MIATGDLYLSRLKPSASTAADGTFCLSLLAYDRQSYRQITPWRLLWTGPAAKAFWAAHKGTLLPGCALEVTATDMRQIVSTGRECGPEIIASVQTLRLPALAANPINCTVF